MEQKKGIEKFNDAKEKSGIFRFVFFTATRTLGTLVDCGVVWLLTGFVFENYFLANVLAPTISFELAVFVNFLTGTYWVFNKRIDNTQKGSVIKRFLKFNLSAVMGFCIKIVVLNLLIWAFGWSGETIGWHTTLCNFLALMVAGLFNYFIADLWVFKRLKTSEPAQDLPEETVR